jgi:hypothetical protein
VDRGINRDMGSRLSKGLAAKSEIPTSRKILGLNESTVEDAALSWLCELGFAVKHGPGDRPR